MNHPGKMSDHANTGFSHVDSDLALSERIKVHEPFKIV
jgi:hypothetical protein